MIDKAFYFYFSCTSNSLSINMAREGVVGGQREREGMEDGGRSLVTLGYKDASSCEFFQL